MKKGHWVIAVIVLTLSFDRSWAQGAQPGGGGGQPGGGGGQPGGGGGQVGGGGGQVGIALQSNGAQTRQSFLRSHRFANPNANQPSFSEMRRALRFRGGAKR